MSFFRSMPVALAAVALAATLSGTVAQEECTDCHDTDTDAVAESAHGFLDCADCHAGAEILPHEDGVGEVDCSTCHTEVVELYAESVHGRSRERGTVEAPGCDACHGEVHSLIPGTRPESPVHPRQLAETCGSCHADPAMVEKFGIPVALPLEAYRQSVHARVLAEEANGASCGSCHGSHGIFLSSDPRSLVNHQRVPDTCGTCHAEIAEAYASSVHGRAVRHGAREAPVCTDCHGEHRILSPREKGSPVYASNVPKMTCGRCHSDLRLAEKYGIKGGTVPAYEDSYHGLASRAGTVTVAHCGSCHGVHDILPSSNPASTIHADNLAHTCGQCHPGAGTRFAIGPVHIVETERHHTAVYWVRAFYLWLIYLAVGGMLIHNLLDFVRKARSPVPRSASARPADPVRMTRAFRIAHGALAASFAVLVYTGFALKYPESWWASPLLHWESTLGLRGWLHRAAAVLMLGALGVHLVHLIVDRRARACIAHMRPRREDWREFTGRLAYFLGRRAEPPRSPWVGYPEKVEYLALMWGIVIMAITGFLLWFEGLALRWLPKWATDVATVIHFYEAVLATLAILIWHFYFVIFDPWVYPMDNAWLTGRSHPARAMEREVPPQPDRAPASKRPSRRPQASDAT